LANAKRIAGRTGYLGRYVDYVQSADKGAAFRAPDTPERKN
jgi:hypothetical protein